MTHWVKIGPQNLLWPFGWSVPWWARCYYTLWTFMLHHEEVLLQWWTPMGRPPYQSKSSKFVHMWCTGVQCLNSENAFVGQPNWPGGQPLGAGSPCHGCWCIHSEWGMNLRGLLDHLGRGKANWQQQGLICWDHKTKDSWYSYMDVDWKFICYSMLSSLKCRHCELGPGSQSGSCSCSFKHWGGFRNSPWVICTKRIFRSREFSRAAPVQPRQETAMKKHYEDAGCLHLLETAIYHLVDASKPPCL